MKSLTRSKINIIRSSDTEEVQKRILTNPAIFFIIAAGFEPKPLANVTINCLSIESFLSFSESTRMISALKPSCSKEESSSKVGI